MLTADFLQATMKTRTLQNDFFNILKKQKQKNPQTTQKTKKTINLEVYTKKNIF